MTILRWRDSLSEMPPAATEDEAIDTFAEQIQGLFAGGADVAWIETMSAPEEMRAAAKAASRPALS